MISAVIFPLGENEKHDLLLALQQNSASESLTSLVQRNLLQWLLAWTRRYLWEDVASKLKCTTVLAEADLNSLFFHLLENPVLFTGGGADDRLNQHINRKRPRMLRRHPPENIQRRLDLTNILVDFVMINTRIHLYTENRKSLHKTNTFESITLSSRLVSKRGGMLPFPQQNVYLMSCVTIVKEPLLIASLLPSRRHHSMHFQRHPHDKHTFDRRHTRQATATNTFNNHSH